MNRFPDPAAIPASDITGLVLCGGRGSRMGGADKGWVDYHGVPLVQHALHCLRPQVGRVLISANRHLDAYSALAGVVPDALADPMTSASATAMPRAPAYDGPLAGIVAALQVIDTPWLACIPCDAPHLPHDLVARLASGLTSANGTLDMLDKYGVPRAPRPDTRATTDIPDGTMRLPARLAVAATRRRRGDDQDDTQQFHPVCALLHVSLAASSAALLARGERRLMTWLTHHNGVVVEFDDDAAFYNINTRQALGDDAPGT